ncbi:MAG: WD40 repeat domain-containing protein, partial [Candidatus Sigynarchaeota archaeon]
MIGEERFPVRHVLRSHSSSVRSLQFSPDGKVLASGAYDGSVLFHDPDSGAIVRRLDAPSKLVNSVAFSPDGKMLACAMNDGSGVQVWDAASGGVIKRLSGPNEYWYVRSVAFSPDGTLLASGDYRENVWLWNTRTWENIRTMSEWHWIREKLTLAQLRQKERTYRHEKRPINCVAFSPDGHVIAAGLDGRPARLWNARTGEEMIEMRISAANSIAFSPDGRFMASAEAEGFFTLEGWVSLWRWEPWSKVRDWKPQGRYRPPLLLQSWRGRSSFNAVAFSPDSRWLAAGSAIDDVRIFDTETYDMVAELKGHASYVNCVAISPDG